MRVYQFGHSVSNASDVSLASDSYATTTTMQGFTNWMTYAGPFKLHDTYLLMAAGICGLLAGLSSLGLTSTRGEQVVSTLRIPGKEVRILPPPSLPP